MKFISKIKQKHVDMTPERRAKWYTLYFLIAAIAYITLVVIEPVILFLSICFGMIGIVIWCVYNMMLIGIKKKQRSDGWRG